MQAVRLTIQSVFLAVVVAQLVACMPFHLVDAHTTSVPGATPLDRAGLTPESVATLAPNWGDHPIPGMPTRDHPALPNAASHIPGTSENRRVFLLSRSRRPFTRLARRLLQPPQRIKRLHRRETLQLQLSQLRHHRMVQILRKER